MCKCTQIAFISFFGALYFHRVKEINVKKVRRCVDISVTDYFKRRAFAREAKFLLDLYSTLSAKKPESAPCPTLVIKYGTTLLIVDILSFALARVGGKCTHIFAEYQLLVFRAVEMKTSAPLRPDNARAASA